MAYLSGKNGTLKLGGNAVAHIRNWTIDDTSNNPTFATNATSCAKTRIAGVKDSTGTFEYVIDDGAGSVPLVSGSTATAQFHIDGTDSNYYECGIIIDSAGNGADINDGGEVVVTYNWGGTSVLQYNGLVTASGS